MLYPLKFEPVYKSILWGGRNIGKKFNRNIPNGNIAESWEVCCREDGMSLVSNGELKGLSLQELMDTYKEDLLGKKYDYFPLLIKIIDANDKLSVQVHPNDEQAKKGNGQNGKTEMWYVFDSKPGAKLIYGLKEGITKSEFEGAIKNSTVEDTLKEVPVKPGDSFYMPSGTVHAILDGILVAEIQQNSNTTYRVYDWNRVDKNGNPRELHIDKALNVIDFSGEKLKNAERQISNSSTNIDNPLYAKKVLASSEYFTVEELSIKQNYTKNTNGDKFYIYMTVEGEGSIDYKGTSLDIKSGDTVMIPACLGEFSISGNLKLLEVFI